MFLLILAKSIKLIYMSAESNKTVYIGMGADILHPGHLNIIKEGQKLGTVTIGLLTDQAIASYKNSPVMEFGQRLEIIKSIKGVERVVPQTTLDYRPNLLKLKPDYVVHGKDWRTGVQQQTRRQVVETLSKWGGSLVEPDYTEGISSTLLKAKLKTDKRSAQSRLGKLARSLESKGTVRVLEAHSGLSAMIVENIRFKNQQGEYQDFDAIWISSFTDSMVKGKPDIELVDMASRVATIKEILEVTTKPIIFDGDTGGHADHFVHTVRVLERLGVSAVVIEDKNGLKRNSLHHDSSDHSQEEMKVFSEKIKAGTKARNDKDFLVIARIESFIIGKSQKDALDRAKAYLDAGADAIMIHSKDKTGEDVKNFASAYKKLSDRKPLMLVPTSYNKIYENELKNWGANIIVYANHLLRASYPAMEKAGKLILENGRALETENISTPIEDFLKMTDKV